MTQWEAGFALHLAWVSSCRPGAGPALRSLPGQRAERTCSRTFSCPPSQALTASRSAPRARSSSPQPPYLCLGRTLGSRGPSWPPWASPTQDQPTLEVTTPSSGASRKAGCLVSEAGVGVPCPLGPAHSRTPHRGVAGSLATLLCPILRMESEAAAQGSVPSATGTSSWAPGTPGHPSGEAGWRGCRPGPEQL